MNFGEALKLVRRGQLVAREGWNGKNMFIFMGFPRVEIHRKVESGNHVTIDAGNAFDCCYSGPVLCMKTAQDDIVVGWLASQTDMLTSDWMEIVRPAKPEALEHTS